MVKIHYRRDLAYQRLMIIFRQLKEYKKEMAVIEEAIDAYSKILFQPKKAQAKKIMDLSRKLTLSTGLAGKTGESIHQPEPIRGWQTRKKGLQKILKRVES